MIIVSFVGQMGNQMFQYAFGKAISKKLYTFFLPFLSSHYYPFKLTYFKLDWFTRFVFSHPKITKQYNRICRKLIKLGFKKCISGDDWNLTSEFRNNIYYEGFFQSDKYFDFIEKKVIKAFAIQKKYCNEFENKYSSFFRQNKVIVIHVRRTDYKEVEFEGLGGLGVDLPMYYYEKALARIPNIDSYKVLIISDDMENVKQDFAHLTNCSFENNSAIIDFQLIQHADIAIIANSTFGWWAAFLSKNTHSVIYAPNYWLGFKVNKEYPVGIKTARFEWVDF